VWVIFDRLMLADASKLFETAAATAAIVNDTVWGY